MKTLCFLCILWVDVRNDISRAVNDRRVFEKQMQECIAIASAGTL